VGGKRSAKDIQTLLDFSGTTGQQFTALSMPGIGVPDTVPGLIPDKNFNDFMQVFRYKSDRDIIDNFLPNPEADVDTVEEIKLDEDGKYRYYRIKKDKNGKEISKSLIEAVDGVTIGSSADEIGKIYTAQTQKNRIFEIMRDAVDPATGEFKQGIGKGFWENALGNSLTYQLGRLGASAFAGKWIGKYGLGQTLFDNLKFKSDGVYYNDVLLTKDKDEIDLFNKYFEKKVTYETDGFLDTFANTFATFAIDAPLFMLAGGISSEVIGRMLPEITKASSLPGKFANALIQNNMTLALAQTPSMINHSLEEGVDAFLGDIQQLGKFSILASVFGVAGEYAGTGISALLRQSRNLSMREATTFLRRNPKVVQMISGTATSGGLGYFSSDGTTEDKLATALTFMSLHFSDPRAWKSYVLKDQKNVMVEKDSFDLLRIAAKNGRTLEEGIKETGVEIPRYYEREKNNLYLIDQNKFVTKGTVERIEQEPITLSKSNAVDYSFISEVVPFVRKTFKQSFEDAGRTKTLKAVYETKFKDIKNPFDKVKEKDSYESFELNKQMSASVVAHLIYADKLTKALRKNQLPEDIKLDKFINETAAFFELPEKVFRTRIKDDMLKYINNPTKFFEEGAYKFTPEQYKTQIKKGIQETLDIYESKAINEEVNRILAKQQLEKDTQLEKHTEIQNEKQRAIIEQDAKSKEIQNREEPKKVKKESLTVDEQARLERATTLGKLEQTPVVEGLVDAKGKPLESTKGAGLTEAERQTYGREREQVKSTAKIKEEVDKIKTIPDLNEALKEADSPVAIIQELKRRFTEKPIENKKEATTKIEGEQKKTKTQKANERRRKIRKLKKANAQSDEELKKAFEESGIKGDYKGIIRGAGKVPQAVTFDIEVPSKITDKLKQSTITLLFKDGKVTPERIKAEAEKKIKQFGDKLKENKVGTEIVEDVKAQVDKVMTEVKVIEEQLKAEGKTEDQINELRFNKEGKLKELYDKAFALDLEKHKKLQLANAKGAKSVLLEDGTIITQPEVKSHLSMKLTPEQRKTIADIGVVDKDGNFKSTMVVDLKSFKEALEIIAKKGDINPIGLDPVLVYNYAKAGAYLFQKGFNTLGMWSKEMLSRFGQGMKKFLNGIWQGTKAILTGEKALFDPNTLGMLGMNSGKEFNEQRIAREKENIPPELRKYAERSLYKNKDEYENAVTVLSKYYDPKTEVKMGKVAPEEPSRPYRPGNLLESGEVLWHPKAVTHADVIIRLQDEGKLPKNFNFDLIESSGSIAPSGVYYDQRFIGDVSKEIVSNVRKRESGKTEPNNPEKITPNNQKRTTTKPDNVEGVDVVGKIEPSLKTISDEIFAPKNKMSAGERKTFKSIVSKLQRYKPKKIKGRLTGTTLTADEHTKLYNIRKVVGVDAKEKEALMKKVVENLGEMELKPEKTATDRQYELEMQSLFENLGRFGAIKDMRGEQLKFANEGLKEIIETGRTKRKAKEEARLKRRNAILEKAIKEIGAPVSTAKARELGYDVEKSGFLRRLSEFDNNMLGFEHLLNKVSGKSSFLSEYFYKKQIKTANQSQDRGIRVTQEAIENKLSEIYGKDKRPLAKELEENRKRQDKTGVFVKETTGEKGKEVTELVELRISQNEGYKKWLELKDPTLDPTFKEMGYNPETIKQLETFLKPKVLEWAKWQIEEFYPTYYKGVNEAFRERFGVDLPFNKFYSPIERSATKEVIDNPLLQRGSQYATVVNKHLSMRVNSKAELKYLDGDKTLIKHIGEMEHFKAWVEPIREMRSVFGDKTFRMTIEQQYGKKMLDLIDFYVDNLARGGSEKSKSYELLDKLRRNFTRAVIGGNPIITVKQLTSIPAMGVNIPTSQFLAGIGDFAANPRKAIKILMDSEMMRTRYSAGAMDRDVQDALSKKVSTQLAGARSISDFLMLSTKLGDKAAILVGGWSVYKYNKAKFLKQGLPEEQAHKRALREFEVVVERTQQSARVEDLSYIQQSGSIGKLFTMFQSAPNAYYRLTSEAVRDLASGKGIKSENIRKLAIAHFVLPMLFQFVADGFNFNDKRQLRAAVLGSLNGLLVIGDLLQTGFAAAQKDFHFGVQGTPVLQTAEDLVQALEKAGKMIEEDDFAIDNVLSFADKIASGTSKLVGIPYGTGKRITKGVIEGEDVRRYIGYSEAVLKQTQSDMKRYKRLADSWRRRYKKDPTPENYASYLEYRRDYRRLLNQLKKEERNK